MHLLQELSRAFLYTKDYLTTCIFIDTNDSPPMKSLLILVFGCITLQGGAQNDSLALVAFYQAMNGPNWTTPWDLHQPMSAWYGVDLLDKRVYGISLISNNLKGELPNAILDLTEMRNFQVGNDSISGTIPDSIQRMKNLQFFYCTKTQLSGSIPAAFGDLESITNLYLSFNELTGELPPSLANWKNLLDFDVSNNQLTGSIPDGFGENSTLRTFNISANHFNGAIPEDLKDAKNLEELILFRNELTDFPPDLMANMNKLRRAQWSENDFSGALPVLPANIESFSCVDNHFSGAIPPSTKDLTHLTTLDIRENDFSEIPDFHGHPSLVFLDIGGNAFTFEDVLPNIGTAEFYTYSDMKTVGQDTVIDVPYGSDFIHRFSIDTSIANKTFHFYKGQVNWMSNSTGLLEFPDFSVLDTGTYQVEITHPDAPDLILRSYHLRLTTEVTTARPHSDTTSPVIIYPNPVQNVLHLQGTDATEKIIITNMLGQLVVRPAPAPKEGIAVSNLSPGVYFLHLQDRPAIRFIKL